MEILIISALIIVQSIFGIGLLLFGTPTFILMGYSFPATLSLLLPISMLISLIQIIFSKKRNINFVKNFNFFCIPALILSIYFILNFSHKVNFNLFISLMILFILFISLFKNLFNFNGYFTKFFLVLIGVVHGLSNLGGTLLSIMSVSLSKDSNEQARFQISYGYFAMALFQYLTLSILGQNIFDKNNIFYLFLVIFIYFPVQAMFKKINGAKFSKLIYFLALIYGIYIFVNSIF